MSVIITVLKKTPKGEGCWVFEKSQNSLRKVSAWTKAESWETGEVGIREFKREAQFEQNKHEKIRNLDPE